MGFTCEWQVTCDYRTKGDRQPDECWISSDSDFSREECLRQATEAGWLILTKKAYCPHCKSYSSVRKPMAKTPPKEESR